MCLMCLEFAKDRMKFFEVRRALGELVSTAKSSEDRRHYEELSELSEEELRKAAVEYAEEQNEE